MLFTAHQKKRKHTFCKTLQVVSIYVLIKQILYYLFLSVSYSFVLLLLLLRATRANLRTLAFHKGVVIKKERAYERHHQLRRFQKSVVICTIAFNLPTAQAPPIFIFIYIQIFILFSMSFFTQTRVLNFLEGKFPLISVEKSTTVLDTLKVNYLINERVIIIHT